MRCGHIACCPEAHGQLLALHPEVWLGAWPTSGAVTHCSSWVTASGVQLQALTSAVHVIRSTQLWTKESLQETHSKDRARGLTQQQLDKLYGFHIKCEDAEFK